MPTRFDSAFSALAPELLDDFFDGGLAIELGGDVAWVRQALYTVVNSGVNYNPSRLSEFAVAVRGDQTSLVGKVPWNVGFTAARSAREALNFSPSETVYDLPVLVLGTTTHKRFSGVGIAQRKGYTTIAVPSRVHNVTKRFAACRALWHASLLEGSQSFLLSNSRAAHQQAGRAFAAEFLAPAAGIEALAREAGPDVQDELAEHFRVSPWLIEYQMRNHVLS